MRQPHLWEIGSWSLPAALATIVGVKRSPALTWSVYIWKAAQPAGMRDYFPTNIFDFDQLKSNIQRGWAPPLKILNPEHILDFSWKIEVQDPTVFQKPLKEQEIVLVKRYRRRRHTRTTKMFFPCLKWTLMLLMAILGLFKSQPLSAGGTLFKPIISEVGR